jgi:hypothetical protein
MTAAVPKRPHAAALDRPAKLKGGAYSEGAIGGGGQFGALEVEDSGATVRAPHRTELAQ